MPLTRELAAFCTALRPSDVPAAALPFIRTAFADTVATLVAGRHSTPVRLLLEELAPARGESQLLWGTASARAPEAAWINATAAHALDFDDAAHKGHISAVLVPTVLAEAQACGSDGQSMVTAYAAGYETWAELFERERDLHHNHAWHPTGVYGPLAAAAACASLRGLDAEQATHALVIAASSASGLIANFGSMAKPLHAGQAAHAGVLAARLAKRGFTGSPDALEHPKGLLAGISPAGRVDRESPCQAGQRWRLPTAGLNTKKFPTCYATHRALDGVLALRAEHALSAADVARVHVTTSRRNCGTLRFARPLDALQAKFSMPFAMAAALLQGRCSLLELDDAYVVREDVRELMARVQVLPEDREDPARPGEAPHDVVALELHDGRQLAIEVDHARGGPQRPLHAGELFAKFETCLAHGGLHTNARALFEALMAIDSLPGTHALHALSP